MARLTLHHRFRVLHCPRRPACPLIQKARPHLTSQVESSCMRQSFQGAQKLGHTISELHVQEFMQPVQLRSLHPDIWAMHMQHGMWRTSSSSRSSFSLSQKRLRGGSRLQAHPCLRCSCPQRKLWPLWHRAAWAAPCPTSSKYKGEDEAQPTCVHAR